MPMKTQSVTSIVLLTCASRLPSGLPPETLSPTWPQKSVVKRPAFMETATTPTKTAIGTNLAIVPITFSTEALLTPRSTSQFNSQKTLDPIRTASQVLPPLNQGGKK